MSIRSRLRLSHMTMVVIPIVFSILVIWLLGHFFIKNLETAYNVKFNLNINIEQFTERTNSTFKKIKAIASYDPDLLTIDSTLKTMDTQLSKVHSGIIVRRDNDVLYASSFINKSDISDSLPKYGLFPMNPRFHPLVGNLVLKPIDFIFRDGSQGSIFIVTDLSYLKNSIMAFMVTSLVSIVIIMVMTNVFLTFVTSKSIVEPLENLKEAALQIKNDNLDYKLSYTSKDEISDVYSAFEEMRVKLKESLMVQQQYENNRKELISNISHDLKTPITAIKGYVEGIMDGIPDSPDKMDRYIKTIFTKAYDMERLIDELFIFSKLDLNKLPFNFEQINIKRYLEDCCEELQLDLEEKHIAFDHNLNNINPEQLVLADREKLKRVIINIVNNSSKYMDNVKGKIEITLTENEDHAIIKIQDNGKGISAEDLPYIFQRFYRADLSRNTSTGGSGLGLAICKLIIEEHGGEIWADSKENSGTSIYFTLKKYV